MSIALVTILGFGTMFLLMGLGLPVAFALGGSAMLWTLFLWGPHAVGMAAYTAYATWTTDIFLAVPMFILMGTMLQHTGIADDAFEMMYRWMGPLRGGLAMGTLVISIVFAAIVGITGASTLTMGLVALPSMLRRRYSKLIAVGSVGAGGALGVLIPPSILIILYAMVTRQSVGQLYTAAFVPGVLLGSLYIAYIAIRSRFQPHLGPPLPPEERANWGEKLVSLKAVILPIALVLLVLGTIYSGIATPTEAAAIGAFGAFLTAAIYRKLNWKVVNAATRATFTLMGMAGWILLGAGMFNNFYRAMGAQRLILNIIETLGVSPWFVIAAMMLSLFILGMVMDDFAVVMLAGPIYTPIIISLGFNPIWFGMLFMVNMQMAYLTPPYGFVLFYLRSIVPPGITMLDIYKSIAPFVGCQAVALTLVIIFPPLSLWLPSLVFQK